MRSSQPCGIGDRDTTCWELIEGAARGDGSARDGFARCYESAVRSYLEARWGSGRLASSVDDAVQDVFLECFRSALGRAGPERSGGFRAYLYGVVRNVARRHERALGRAPARLDTADLQKPAHADPESLGSAFARAWAQGLMRQARERLRGRAAAEGPEAGRREELLRRRVADGVPIREIAAAWGEDPAHVHRQYARARREFRRILLDVVAEHLPGASRGRVEAECLELLGFLETRSRNGTGR